MPLIYKIVTFTDMVYIAPIVDHEHGALCHTGVPRCSSSSYENELYLRYFSSLINAMELAG